MAHFHHFSICNQNKPTSILVIFRQNTKAIALLFGQKWLIFITFQSAIKINANFKFGHFWAKYQGYSLTFWPKMAHFHHFSICNQGYNGEKWLIFNFICNQNKPTSILVIFGQNTKAIALLFGQNWLIFITFQSAIKMNANFNFGHFSAKYQGYSLTFWPKMAHFHHFSICNQNECQLQIWSFFGKIPRL